MLTKTVQIIFQDKRTLEEHPLEEGSEVEGNINNNIIKIMSNIYYKI